MNKTSKNIQRVTVMGLGLFGGGLGVAEYWAKQGKDVIVTDLKDKATLAPTLKSLEKYKNISYTLTEHKSSDFTDTDLLIVNPAVKPDNKYVKLAIESNIPITTEIGIFISEHKKNNKNSVLAITGSNGKSTTTSLLANILKTLNTNTLSGGNIGGSLLSKLNSYPSGTPAVLELSSFQLHYLAKESFSPNISIITNLAPNHLDWHNTVKNYYHDKKAILSSQPDDSYSILNYDDEELRTWKDDTKSNVFYTSLEDHKINNSSYVKNNQFAIRHNEKEIILGNTSSLQLPGKHNLSNAIQAITAAYLYLHMINSTKNKEIFDQGLKKFNGLEHRQEVVAEFNNKLFINDSIATTPESTIAALNSYKDRDIIIIAGGYDKKIPLNEMSKEIARKAKGAVLIGQTAEIIMEQIIDYSPNFDVTLINESNFEKAIKIAANKVTSGIVLLSPGCASYGMFANFKERGNKFKEIINNKLAANN